MSTPPDLSDAGSRARFLIRDRDGKYPPMFDTILADTGITVVLSGVRMPRMNTFAERWVRTLRSECLDWTLIWNQRQLDRVLTEYLRRYNTARPHRSLDLQPPNPANPARRLMLVESSTVEPSVRRVDVLGGLIHEYRRAA